MKKCIFIMYFSVCFIFALQAQSHRFLANEEGENTNPSIAKTQGLQSLADSIFYDEWSSSLNDWDNNVRFIYLRDAQGNILETTTYIWIASTQNWQNSSKYVYQYNASNKRTNFQYYTWNMTSSSWQNSGKATYSYNANGLQSDFLYEKWDNTSAQWQNYSHYNRWYNANNKVTNELDFAWNTTSQSWDSTYKYLYQYNANNELIEWQAIAYDSTHNWINESQYLYTYTNGFVSSYQYNYWDLGMWTPSSQSNYVRDGLGYILTINSLIYNLSTNTWENGGKSTYNYTNSDLSTIVLQSWDALSSTWVNQNRWRYFYSEYNVAIEAPSSLAVQIYPNPANNLLYIDSPIDNGTINIYNSVGTLVSSFKIENHLNPIPLSTLGNGLYFWEVCNQKTRYHGKFIKE